MSKELKSEEEAWVALVRRQVSSLQYGVVQLVVHDGRVIQIEKTEKLRLNSGAPERTKPSQP